MLPHKTFSSSKTIFLNRAFVKTPLHIIFFPIGPSCPGAKYKTLLVQQFQVVSEPVFQTAGLTFACENLRILQYSQMKSSSTELDTSPPQPDSLLCLLLFTGISIPPVTQAGPHKISQRFFFEVLHLPFIPLQSVDFILLSIPLTLIFIISKL